MIRSNNVRSSMSMSYQTREGVQSQLSDYIADKASQREDLKSV